MKPDFIEKHEQITQEIYRFQRNHLFLKRLQLIANIISIIIIFILYIFSIKAFLFYAMCLLFFNIGAFIERKNLSRKIYAKKVENANLKDEAVKYLAIKHNTTPAQINYYLADVLKGHRDFQKTWWQSEEQLDVIDQALFVLIGEHT